MSSNGSPCAPNGLAPLSQRVPPPGWPPAKPLGLPSPSISPRSNFARFSVSPRISKAPDRRLNSSSFALSPGCWSGCSVFAFARNAFFISASVAERGTPRMVYGSSAKTGAPCREISCSLTGKVIRARLKAMDRCGHPARSPPHAGRACPAGTRKRGIPSRCGLRNPRPDQTPRHIARHSAPPGRSSCRRSPRHANS